MDCFKDKPILLCDDVSYSANQLVSTCGNIGKLNINILLSYISTYAKKRLSGIVGS